MNTTEQPAERLTIPEVLEGWLRAGEGKIGEVLVSRRDNFYLLQHHRDAEDPGVQLHVHDQAASARDVARYTANGTFRPLKTAPTLRRGWQLRLQTLEEVREALDYLYPGALGLWTARLSDRLDVTSLRENLERQTGMYRFARTVTDTGAQQQILRTCHQGWGCLRRVLWPVSEGKAVKSLPMDQVSVMPDPGEIPLLCPEACSILVSDIRKTAKRESMARKSQSRDS